MYRPQALGIRIVTPGKEGMFGLPDNYMEVVDEIAQDFNEKLRNPDNYITYENESMYITLKDPNSVKAVREFTKIINFNTIFCIYNTKLQYTPALLRTPLEGTEEFKKTKASTWEWHTDNSCEWVIKIMLYLTNVYEGTAPFEYLSHMATGEPKKVPFSQPPYYPKSRIPKEFIDKLKECGYRHTKIIGPKGTIIIFDNNIIHTKNIAKTGHRDVLILTIRPK